MSPSRRKGYSYWDDYGYDDEDDDLEYGEAAEDHETPSDATVIEGPIYAASKRGEMSSQWWGKRWLTALDQFYSEGRIERGRRYARNGSVESLEISYGKAYAHVQGSRPRPYRTEIYVKPLSDKQWEEALSALAGQAIYAAKLLAGEMPADIEAIFEGLGISLFPESLHDVSVDCSCPDEWGDPCKHGAAVYYLLADQIDADPFVLFHLRGRTRDQILSALRSLRGAAASDQPISIEPETTPLDADLEAFWGGPKTNLIRSAPVEPNRPPLLEAYGDPPGIGPELRKLYPAVSHQAKEWLGLDTDQEEA